MQKAWQKGVAKVADKRAGQNTSGLGKVVVVVLGIVVLVVIILLIVMDGVTLVIVVIDVLFVIVVSNVTLAIVVSTVNSVMVAVAFDFGICLFKFILPAVELSRSQNRNHDQNQKRNHNRNQSLN